MRLTAISVLASLPLALTTSPQIHKLPPLREQARLQDAWTQARKDLIPDLLEKHNVDAWLISQLEHAEETIFPSLAPAVAFSARRRTLTLFLTRATAARAASGSPSSQLKTEYTFIDNTPALYDSLRSLLEATGPARIAVNAAEGISFSGSLAASELAILQRELDLPPPGRGEWGSGFVVRPMLGVEVVGTIVEGRLGWYGKLMETAWAVLGEGLSEKAIVPGETSEEDLEWWFRERLWGLGYGTWFQPGVTVVDEHAEIFGNFARDDEWVGEKSERRVI